MQKWPVADASYAEIRALDSDDIDTPNRFPPPGWSQVVYRLGAGPFRYSALRVDLGEGVDLEHARFLGAARLVGALQPEAVHVLFPGGRDLRLRGVPVRKRLIVLTPPGASFEGATQAEAYGHSVVVRGKAFARLRGLREEANDIAHWCRGQAVFEETPAAEALRLELEAYFDLVGRLPDLAFDARAKAYARTNFLDLMGQAIAAVRTGAASAVPSEDAASRALALAAERWIWDRIAEPSAAPISLGATAQALGYSVRRVQQAIESHFGISFVKFVRAARLHQAHAALVREPGRVAVSTIATRYGFWHLGRFSGYYRDMFGHAPSHVARHRSSPDVPVPPA